MACGLHDERLVDDLRGVAEAGLEIAVRPLLRRRPHRQTTFRRFGHLFGRPLQRADGRSIRRRAWRRGLRRVPRVSLEPRVCAARPQALHRIDDEGQRLEGDGDALDRVGGSHLVYGGDGEDRLAEVERFVGEDAFGARLRRGRQVVDGEDGLDARHGQRGARVDAGHASVGHRAQEELGEEHAFRAEVLGVAGASGDLRYQVRRGVVPADELRICHGEIMRLRTGGTLPSRFG